MPILTNLGVLVADFFANAQDYYMLFCLTPFSDPSREDVDAAYRACHRKYRCHPNWRQNNTQSLSEEEKQRLVSQCAIIENAHDVLSDPAKRKQYDEELKRSLGMEGRLSWWEKMMRGLLCAGMVIEGRVQVQQKVQTIFPTCDSASPLISRADVPSHLRLDPIDTFATEVKRTMPELKSAWKSCQRKEVTPAAMRNMQHALLLLSLRSLSFLV